jgi:hypothetical protein
VWTAPPGSTPKTYQVTGVSGGSLYERTGPGSEVDNTSDIWDLLTTGYFVSDHYVTTPNVGRYSPGLSQCQETTRIN